ncbi:hypothetical protein [Novosphingobium naphthalenivorans]|nr:hypothetical protein [Novosphingobium naphthalenivorans]
MDVFIDSHCHLIRTTRCLIAWGTTLHVAVNYLDTVPASAIVERLGELGEARLSGNEEHHVGAPQRLWDIASRIVDRIQRATPDREPPTLGMIYLLALQQLPNARGADLMDAFERTQTALRRPQVNNRTIP